jgi:hypothetical protein
VLTELRGRLAVTGQGVPTEQEIIAAALRVALRHPEDLLP